MPQRPTNPFRYGDLALDDAFTDRDAELAELTADIRNGQNVVVFAPRRFGKSSLLWRASQELIATHEVLIAQVDLMKTPTKARFAEKLAASIHDDIASVLFKVRERALAIFSGLRIAPTMTVDAHGSLSFSFSPGYAAEDIDATIERLLELPAVLAAERGRRVALILDEFQEITKLGPDLLPLMRSVFQEQPEVSHVYLGSKRHTLRAIFNDENEPFWRSAKQMELGAIPCEVFREFLQERFASTGRSLDGAAAKELLRVTQGHPYGTQELAYALWELTPAGGAAGIAECEAALARVLRAENAHFSSIWERAPRAQRQVLEALAREPGASPSGSAYRNRHALPGPSTIQRALGALAEDELVGRFMTGYRIAEPFLAEWIVSNDI